MGLLKSGIFFPPLKLYFGFKTHTVLNQCVLNQPSYIYKIISSLLAEEIAVTAR